MSTSSPASVKTLCPNKATLAGSGSRTWTYVLVSPNSPTEQLQGRPARQGACSWGRRPVSWQVTGALGPETQQVPGPLSTGRGCAQTPRPPMSLPPSPETRRDPAVEPRPRPAPALTLPSPHPGTPQTGAERSHGPRGSAGGQWACRGRAHLQPRRSPNGSPSLAFRASSTTSSPF